MRIGLDVGGTKIEIVVLDERGAVRHQRRVPTPRGDYEATVAAIRQMVADAEAAAGPASVGIGIPGTVSSETGLIKNANSTWLNGRPLAADLQAALGRAVRLGNDANCFALSEAVDGAGAGARVVFGVIIGTGTGGGIVVDQQVLVGPNGVAGEWGHNPLPWPADGEWPGPPCYCGRTGCIETFLSGPALERDYAALAEAAGLPPAAASTLEARAAAGERAANEALAQYERRLARALASVVNLLDPDVIVLGGGVSNITRLYSRVPELWGPFVFSDSVRTRLVPARHGDASGVRGAAWLWEGSRAIQPR